MKRHIALCVMLCVIVSCFAGCALHSQQEDGFEFQPTETKSNAILVAERYKVENPYGGFVWKRLTNEAKRKDYQFFWDVLESGAYPFLNLCARQGADLPAIKQKFAARLPHIRSKRAWEGFFHKLVKEITNYNQTGHLDFLSQDVYTFFYDTYAGLDDQPAALKKYSDQEWPASYETLFAPYIEVLQRARVQGHYDLSPKAIAAFRQKMKEASSSPTAAMTKNSLERKLLSDQAAYVKIDSFLADPHADRDALFFFYQEMQDVPNLIIDIRRNTGGSTFYWHDLIVAPNIGEAVSYENYVVFADNEFTQDYIEARLPNHRPISRLPEFEHLNQQDMEGLTSFQHSQITVAPLPEAGPLYPGKIWVLTSPYNYSAAEGFVAFCQQTNFATLVGETTRGGSGGIDPFLYMLPNSGLVFRASNCYSLNPDGSCNEEYATQPDYVVEPGQDALAKCLQIIAADAKKQP